MRDREDTTKLTHWANKAAKAAAVAVAKVA
jgi:hypothetical protein